MGDFSGLFKKEQMSQLLLIILFIIYLIMGYKTPEPIANIVDTLIGKIIIFIIVIMLFIHANPILAVLALFVAFDLLRRASETTGIDALKRYLPTEEKKSSQFTAFNQYPYTLEQEVVKKMAPLVRNSSNLSKASYKPLLDNLYGASSVTTSNN